MDGLGLSSDISGNPIFRRQILLTGDKTHFGPLYGHRIKGVEVQSPAGLAEQLE